mmetsp:Transcript_37888/g.87985  ORF Transcript_37888/g.87985 Transcript_37888/m.87985 type:complete len:184 (+) Transcript_37888:122-673(+)
MSVLVPKTRLLLFRDGSSSGTSGWHQCKQGLPAPDTIDGVNGLQVSLPSLLQPLPPGPKVPEAPRLISGRIAGKLAHKTHKVQVEVDGEEEDVWIEGDKGPIWVMVHGQLWYGPRKDGYWGTHKSDHGWGRHWSVLSSSEREIVVLLTAKHQRKVRMQMPSASPSAPVTAAELSEYIRSHIQG